MSELRVVILGLSITSSWGNGHATNYRALVQELARRGSHVTFLERDVPWYASQRDLPVPPWGQTFLYGSLDELRDRHAAAVREADLVVVGSYVPEGVDVGTWVAETAEGITAFYDIDTPVTIAKLERGDFEYLSPELVPRFDLYLSFTGGPTLGHIETALGSPRARPFYCVVDPERYFPLEGRARWDLGYLGTYSDDRQAAVENLLIQPARTSTRLRFVVAGPQYPEGIEWPPNVERVEHLPPAEHRRFYNSQRFTLNITRADMVRAGYSPSVRLFEAAACGVPIISDEWPGIEEFFVPGSEILLASGPGQVLAFLDLSDEQRGAIAERARRKVLARHTAAHRVDELKTYVEEVQNERAARGRVSS